MNKPETFATHLRRSRLERGLSQAELAQRVGVSKTTLGNWESERTLPSAPELGSLMEALSLGGQDQRALRRLVALPRALVTLPPQERPPLTGGLLRALRLRRGLTQSEVARRLQMRQGTLAKWEKSEDWPSTERLTALCMVLGAHPAEVEAILGGAFLPQPLPWDASPEWLNEEVDLLRNAVGDKPGQALLDLRFLELEALLQLRAEEPAVRELLWQLWIIHAIYFCYQARYEEALQYTNRLLEIPHDLSKACSAPFQVAAIKKATALLRPLEVPGAYRPRQTRAALSFLLAQQTQIVIPECQAWYWMYLGELFIMDRAYDEAERCIERSNAIPHPDLERIETPEARLLTANHLIDLGKPQEGLTLLDAPILEREANRSPWIRLRRTHYRAKALVELQEVAEADELIRQSYALMEAHQLEVMRGAVDTLAFRMVHLP
ncbi:helix-turn-helix transcriptional regulator [Armatimonas rosea]|uniref:Transcriptional regulator with XRE-family HTH domain n=1 Tax=Armatimonas rosea TaxID=685828 RepID=A0A7W9SLI2_ARMRO|nr:helix-turn-helix transcriptional regulator [Armatimonas rosea]MBB6048830.1 transcriptional regulator with XRE-family HTH domain [Armatimonas rosea]